MAKKLIIIILIFLQVASYVPVARAEYEDIYHYYIQLGIESFYKSEFENAYFYFKTAHAIDPSRQQSLQYLNLIKRISDGRLTPGEYPAKGNELFNATEEVSPTSLAQAQLVAEVIWQSSQKILSEYPPEKIDRPTIDQIVGQITEKARQDIQIAFPDAFLDQVIDQAREDVNRRVDDYLVKLLQVEREGKPGPTFVNPLLEPEQVILTPPQASSGLAIPPEKESVRLQALSTKTEDSSIKQTSKQVSAVAAPLESANLPVSKKEKIEPIAVQKVEVSAKVEKPTEIKVKEQNLLKEPVAKEGPSETKTIDQEVSKIGSLEVAPQDIKAVEQQSAMVSKSKESSETTKPVATLEASSTSTSPEDKIITVIQEGETTKINPKSDTKKSPAVSSEVKAAERQKTSEISKPSQVKASVSKPDDLLNPTELSVPKKDARDPRLIRLAGKEELRLNEELWALQPTTTLEIEIGKTVVISAKNITKWLAITEGILDIKRVNADQISLTGVKRGTTILHIWEQRGRWTFTVRTVYAFELQENLKKYLPQEYARPFRVEYSNSWNTLHRGPNLGDMERQSLTFTNWLGIYGDTPYGYADAWVQTNMFPQSTEIVGKGIGLTDGHIGPFDDFTIRGYDTSKRLSALTMPGRYFRGVLLDAYAFKHKIAYSYFYGQDQSISLYSNTTQLSERNSYLEGFKIKLFPDEAASYAINYVRGFGEARPAEFKDQLYSVETTQRFKNNIITAELAYDKTDYGFLAGADYDSKEFSYNLNFRDLQRGFQTVYGIPTYDGQIGGQFNAEWKKAKHIINTYLDIYRDRQYPNPDAPNGVNLDLSTSYSKQLNSTSTWSSNISYLTTPQTITPHQTFQLSNTYSKVFKILGSRYLSTYIGQGAQISRYDEMDTSDYDRFSLRSGFRLNLIKNFAYFFNYDYIWVRDLSINDWSNPTAIATGVNYSVPLTEKLVLDLDLTYRNEMQAKSVFSFLAGEDSISNFVSLTYNPVQDVRIYLDSQLRRVWPEVSNTDPYYDWNLMLGMQAGWDLPFRWNPTGIVAGTVYKDLNGNGLQDKDEPGMAGVKVLVGKFETLTNGNGEYLIKARAKKATVSLDYRTIPHGFVFSTALSREVQLEHNKEVRVNFGLSSRSGIYGVAYSDDNGSGKPDHGDKFFPSIIVRLDDSEITKTDSSGAYFFENIKPGKHKIKIDVASIPIEYVPTVKVQAAIDLTEGTTYVYNIPLKKTIPQK